MEKTSLDKCCICGESKLPFQFMLCFQHLMMLLDNGEIKHIHAGVCKAKWMLLSNRSTEEEKLFAKEYIAKANKIK